MSARILILTHEFPPVVGGVSTAAVQLTRFLVGEGYETHVMVRRISNRMPVEGAIFHDVDVLPKFWFVSYSRALEKLGLGQFDHIILNYSTAAIVAGKFFDEATLSRCLLLLHGLEVEDLYEPRLVNLPRQLFGFARAHRRAARLSRHLVAVGEDMADKFANAYPNARRDEIKVVRMGADADLFKRQESDFRKQRNISPETLLLVSAGRVVRGKGFSEMLDAFEKLVSKRSNVHWVVCGDGEYLATLKRDARARELSGKMTFEGFCDQAKLCWIYNDCDLFWLVSQYREAFGLVYAEANLTGLPAIGRNRGGVPEAIATGEGGWLVESAADAVQIITEFTPLTGKERERIATAAMRHSMNHTLQALLPLLA